MALKYIRDNLKSFFWVLWIVVAALVGLVFFEWGGFSSAGNVPDVAAVVGDEEISFADFQRTYRNIENQYRQTFGEQFNDELAKQFNLPVQALDQLIDRRILLMEAEKIGLQVSKKEIQRQILDYPVFQEDGKFVGVEEYQNILRRNRLTTEGFESSLREDLLLVKLESILAGSAYVSDSEVEEAYRAEVERAKVRYVELPASSATVAEEITRLELEEYLAANADDYEVPEQRVADYLLVDSGRMRGQVTIEEAEARGYYDENPAEFEKPEQVLARHILRKTGERSDEEVLAEVQDIKRRIEGGEDFATLAGEMSEDPGSAANGGELPPFGRGAMLPPFENASFSAPLNTLTEPVKTTFGYHLIEVLDRTEAGAQPFEEVRARIEARLKNEKVQTLAESKAFEIAGQIAEDAGLEALQAIADGDDAINLATTEPFSQADSIPGFGRAPAFNDAVFGLEEGALSEPLRVPRGWAIASLKEVLAPRAATLDEVETEIRGVLTRERQKAAAVSQLQELAAQGKSLDDIATELSLEAKESSEFGPTGTIPGMVDSQSLVQAAFEMGVGEMGTPVAAGQGAVLFELLERSEFDPTQFEEDKASTRAREERQRLSEMRGAIIEQRRRELVPQYSAQVMENFGIETPSAQ